MPINEWSDSIFIVELNDEPAFSEDMDALLRKLDDAAAALPDVIVDVHGVTYLNSSNIAQLLKVRKRLIDAGSRLRLCAASDRVWSIMLATGLDSVFEFMEDISTSLASLQIGE
jgi:stage II sporulation protein AA (anti-sigma F factor antagonist)